MEEFLERLRELAQQLAYQHFSGPPVDPYQLAERLGIVVKRTSSTTTVRWQRVEGHRVIYLPRQLPPDRARFLLAHEIMELQSRVADPPLTVEPGVAIDPERLYQWGASELLMPLPWFSELGAESDWNLGLLRSRFMVSWEAAARRIPLCTPAVCTILDNHRVTSRLPSAGLRCPRQLTPEERAVVDAVYAAWPTPYPVHRVGEPPLSRISAWPALPEHGRIRRVCLLTHVQDS